jgi:hypothetical protein
LHALYPEYLIPWFPAQPCDSKNAMTHVNN